MYYTWEQGQYMGIVEAENIDDAKRQANQVAPYNPSREYISVRKSTTEDKLNFMAMGGGIDGKPLN